MTGQSWNFSSGIAAPIGLVTTAEIVVATLSGLVTPYSGMTVRLDGQVLLTTAGSTTAVVTRIRRKSLTGTLVSDETGQTIVSTAGDTNFYGVFATDAPGEVTGYTYVLTAQDTAGASGGTTVYAILNAIVY